MHTRVRHSPTVIFTSTPEYVLTFFPPLFSTFFRPLLFHSAARAGFAESITACSSHPSHTPLAYPRAHGLKNGSKVPFLCVCVSYGVLVAPVPVSPEATPFLCAALRDFFSFSFDPPLRLRRSRFPAHTLWMGF